MRQTLSCLPEIHALGGADTTTVKDGMMTPGESLASAGLPGSTWQKDPAERWKLTGTDFTMTRAQPLRSCSKKAEATRETGGELRLMIPQQLRYPVIIEASLRANSPPQMGTHYTRADW